MDKFRVLKAFRDKEDRNAADEPRKYAVNDEFPATKRKVANDRVEFLQEKGFISKNEAE